jgi:ABC-type lipoprotein export system ATPase subunit
MIKLNNLEKYFNRKKANEIHVINNIDLTLPDKGLVVLLGPSGSGKTTLLNVLGGLDKVQSGSIEFDEQVISGYSSGTWDRIRNKEVGYIFQNYNLLTNLTVYDNIALTLNMVNIYDKEEIDKRIDYILDAMGMINYRKRRAAQLSGGQQQRVAIARALAKNPKVIIADEPTGNLDSKNTQDIMNIIKKISLNKLVVLVTHEENIANFYGDRIIRLQDGEIVSDTENRSNGSLDVKHETDIFLGDLREVGTLDNANAKIKMYSDEDVIDDLDIRLIVKNKTIYLDVKSKEYRKMQLLETDSEINILPGKYEKLQKTDLSDTDFNLESVITEKDDDLVRHSVITFKDSLKLAVSRLRGASRLGKLFYFGFAMGAVLIAVAVGMLSGIYNFDSTKFLQGPKEAVIFDKDLRTYDEIVALSDHESIDYYQFAGELSLQVDMPSLFQIYDNRQNINSIAIHEEFLDETKLIEGHGIEAINEFVMDNDYADSVLSSGSFSYLGITSYADLMKLDFILTTSGAEGDYQMVVKLVGIVEDESEVMYASEELINMSTFNTGLYEMYDDLAIEDGRDIENDGEVLINEAYLISSDQTFAELEILFLQDKEYEIIGSFSSDTSMPRYIVKTEDIEEAYFLKRFATRNADITFISNDIDATIDYLKAEGVTAESSYASQLKEYSSSRLAESVATLVFTFVVLGASAISYFFILRSSLLSRIYEVSVYRALGVSKGDISKMFLTEILLITMLTSVIGYAVATYFLYRFQLLVEDFTDVIYISPISIVGGLVIIFLVNIIAGLIPVTNLLRKTPAEILSKYDF